MTPPQVMNSMTDMEGMTVMIFMAVMISMTVMISMISITSMLFSHDINDVKEREKVRFSAYLCALITPIYHALIGD